MIASMHNFHFLRPGWLSLLPVALCCCYFLYKYSQKKSEWQPLVDAHLLPYLTKGSDKKHSQWPILLLTCIWVLSVFALSGPTWFARALPVIRQTHAVVLAVDMSPAMLAQDLKPNRATRAKFKIRDLLRTMNEVDVGVLAFSKEPYVVSPLTHDPETILSLIPELNPHIMPTTGSDIGAALQRASQMIKQSGLDNGHIFLMTANKPTANDLKIAEKLAKHGFKISVMGVGTRIGAPVPDQVSGFSQQQNGKLLMSKLAVNELTELANKGRGIYSSISPRDKDIEQLLNSIATSQSNVKNTQQISKQWVDCGIWLLFPILILFAFTFRRGWLNTRSYTR